MADEQDITRILAQVRAGDPEARDELFRRAYDELRRRAHFALRQNPSSATINTTVLVHEAYLKLAGSAQAGWEDRGHFYRVAGRAMRQILLDQARRRLSLKRGGGLRPLDIDELQIGVEEDANRLVALDDALSRLQGHNPRLGQVVELRFFAGLSVEETAAAMEISVRTVKRDWRLARAFLHGELEDPDRPT